MRIIRLATLAAVLLPGCNWSFEPYQCTTTRQVIASQRVDFETSCAGAPCDASVVGRVTIVPSVLPGDHALAIDAASSITWSWELAGGGSHTAIGMNFRCDDGGSLRLLGDRSPTSDAPGIDVSAGPAWRHGSWTLAAGAETYATREAAQAGRYTATVEVRNVGTARCVIDQVSYASTAEVCSSSSPCGSSFGHPALQCGTQCVDPLADPNHCGGCGHVCPSGQHCSSGTCANASICLFRCIGRVCGVDECGTGSCGVCGAGERCTVVGRCVSGSERDAGPTTSVDGGVVTEPDGGGRGAVVAGRSCTDDRTCATPSAPLSCVSTPGGNICSLASGCQPGTPSREEAQCGGRYSRCLLLPPGDAGALRGLCTRSCVAGAATESEGACPANAVCTGSWLLSVFGPGDNGCLPFCHDDADCAGLAGADAGADAGSQVCNVWTGRCGATASSLLAGADGTRCDPARAAASGVNPCRGMCFTLDRSRPSEGLCGSLIDRRVMRKCPEPDVLPAGPSGDDLAVCVAAACDDNAGCRDGLVCVYPEADGRVRSDYGPSWCAYPTALQPRGIERDGGTAFDAAVD